MRVVGSALLLLAVTGCATGVTLVAGPFASFDGGEILPLAVQVEPLGTRRASRLLGLDPVARGVMALEVRVSNRTFEPITLPGLDGWTIHDSRAGAPIAEGLSPAMAAELLEEAIRAEGGSVARESLEKRLARQALTAGVVAPGGVSRGLVYLRPGEKVRLDAEGLTGRFVAVTIGDASSGGGRPVAGRLRP